MSKAGSGKPIPDAISSRTNSSVLMRPLPGSEATNNVPGVEYSFQSNRTKAAAEKLIIPDIKSVISDINSKGGSIKQIEISVTITTKPGNSSAMNEIKKNLLAIYPTANVAIKYDSKFNSTPSPGNASSTEDFGYKIEGKGYKK